MRKSGNYLSKKHREMRKEQGGKFDEVQIVMSPLGERLQIDNQYAFIVVSYLREFLADMCQLAASLQLGKK